MCFMGEHRLGEYLVSQALEGSSSNLLGDATAVLSSESRGRRKPICYFVGHHTCRALGEGTDKAKCEQRFLVVQGEGLALFCSCC